ncbi:MAG: hypothetical protein JSU87_04975 [Gemmatimonadota bacterium]|nr:MAG: hypothetical protein JSU87_04975 [Gemmatimonadota bacterium]
MNEKKVSEVDSVALDELKDDVETDVYVDEDPVRAVHVLANQGIAPPSPEQRVLDTVQLVKDQLPADASKEVQEETAKILALMEALLISPYAGTRLAMAEMALHRLIKAPQDTTLAKKVTANLRKQLGGRLGLWFNRVRVATPPHVDVLIGMVASIAVFGGLFIFGADRLLRAIGVSQQLIADQDLQNLIWLGATGAFGSVISILVRLNDFAKMQDTSAWLNVMNGFFKPVIGLATADLAYVLIKSQLIPLSFQDDYAKFAFMGIAFVAGFSERLVNDLASITERAIGAAAERGIEAQRVGPEAKQEEEQRREIEADLSGSTEIGRADIYESVDLDDLDEAVESAGEAGEEK